MLQYITLGMVLENGKTGYDIKKCIENGIGVFYKASFGSLYPALKKLTEKGCLTTCEKPYGGRQKIYYNITEAGKALFLEWLCMPMDIFEGTNTHLAKVYFFDKLPGDIRDRQLRDYENNNVLYLKKLLEIESRYTDREDKQLFYYKLSTLYYGICIIQKTIQWCRHIRKQKPLANLKERVVL